jgi:hypothetical protein
VARLTAAAGAEKRLHKLTYAESSTTETSSTGAQIGAKAEMEQKQIITKEVLEGAKLGAAAVNKQKDINLREKESQLRNTTKVKETKLKDDNIN